MAKPILQYDLVHTVSGCLLWPGATYSTGYGVVRRGGQTIGAHRQSYIENKGEVPAGHYVCHTCDTPLCVNPEHLFAGTSKQNNRDMVVKGRKRSWGNGVTHCPKGHAYTEGNTYNHGGIRHCKECRRTRSREYQRRRAQERRAAL